MNRETIMSTLFAMLTSPPLVFQFSADVYAGNPILQSVSDTSGLFSGMPITGPGFQAGTVLADANALTLSLAPTATNFNATLTQGFATTGRRLQAIAAVTNMPAMFLVEGSEVYPGSNTGAPHALGARPQIISLEPYLWVYSKTDDPSGNPNAIINVLLDGVDKAMLPTNGRALQNLGLSGIHHCRVEGKALRSPGLAGSASARVQFVIQAIQGVDSVPLP